MARRWRLVHRFLTVGRFTPLGACTRRLGPAAMLTAIAALGFWLGYLAYLSFGDAGTGDPSPWEPVSLIAFAVVYVVVSWLSLSAATAARRGAVVALAALFVLGAATVIAFGARGDVPVRFIYVSVACAMALAMRYTIAGVAAATAVQAAISLWLDTEVAEIVFVGVLTFILGVATVALRRMVEFTDELERAREQVRRLAAREERMRISRDMHDLLGHSLSHIALKGALIRRAAAPHTTASDHAREIESVARRTLQEMRATVAGYRETSLQDELSAACDLLRAAGIEASVRGRPAALSVTTQVLLGLVVREAVTNVVRHSHARRCEVTIGCSGDGVELDVYDDGTVPTRDAALGSGLRGAAERLGEAGGALDAGPVAGGGFRLRATLALGDGERRTPQAAAGSRSEGAP